MRLLPLAAVEHCTNRRSLETFNSRYQGCGSAPSHTTKAMFAVKGWAVDASALKPQSELFRTNVGNTAATTPTDGADAQDSRKKRKRGGEPAAQNLDVGKLWEQHIEGKKPKKAKTQAKLNTATASTAQIEQYTEPRKPALAKTNVAAVDKAEGVVQKRTKSEKKSKEKALKEKDNAANGVVDQEQPPSQEGEKLEKKKKKKKSTDPAPKGKDHAASGIAAKSSQPTPGVQTAVVNAAEPQGPKLTPMQAAMRQKLISARFRHLNETLYTEPSAKALDLFNQNPEMFEDYHSGFRQQVTTWPENPVDSFISTIRSRGNVRLLNQKKLFRNKGKQKEPEVPQANIDRSVLALPRTKGTCIIADLGCGDARLAQILKDSGDGAKLSLRVHSYDLAAPSPLITKADISNIPIADGSVDVAIFCLALMGTNWITFIEEAYRILHWKGELWIAEIKSRFGRIGRAGRVVEHSVGGKRKMAALKKAQEAKKREAEDVNEQQVLSVEVDEVPTKNEETDVTAFVDVLKRRGFVLKNDESSIDLSNRMFVRMEFVKAATPTKGKGKPDEPAQQSQPKFRTKAKFLEEDNNNDPATDDEAKVLKPCLYKIR
jgi:ribosomal RNA-processing protein 8